MPVASSRPCAAFASGGGRPLALLSAARRPVDPHAETDMTATPPHRTLLRTIIYLSVLLLPGCVVFTCRI
jgi:hypothetical protein